MQEMAVKTLGTGFGCIALVVHCKQGWSLGWRRTGQERRELTGVPASTVLHSTGTGRLKPISEPHSRSADTDQKYNIF